MFNYFKRKNNGIKIKILKVKEGDIMVVKSDSILSDRDVRRVKELLNKIGISNEVLLLDKNTDIEILRKA